MDIFIDDVLQAEHQLNQARNAFAAAFDECFLLLGSKRDLKSADWVGAKYHIKDCTQVGDMYQTIGSVYKRVK